MVLFDTSDSMGWEEIRGRSTLDAQGRTPIEVLRQEVPGMIRGIAKEVGATLDIAVGEFYGHNGQLKVRWLTPSGGSCAMAESDQPFHRANEVPITTFPVGHGGTSPISSAFKLAIDEMRRYMDKLIDQGVSVSSRPSVCVFTDGAPQSDDEDADAAMRKVQEVSEKIKVFGLGTDSSAVAYLNHVCLDAALVLPPDQMTAILKIVKIMSTDTRGGSAASIVHRVMRDIVQQSGRAEMDRG
ncbi:MAG: hypothetical protein QM621_04105 [Aeromicrobium sp.]|uniref:hypothetical protein n=1 Tax=Aeromicrobium sp. TaxID=1871063 RepID=UPI0039E6565F